jgi:hypothetical protein
VRISSDRIERILSISAGNQWILSPIRIIIQMKIIPFEKKNCIHFNRCGIEIRRVTASGGLRTTRMSVLLPIVACVFRAQRSFTQSISEAEFLSRYTHDTTCTHQHGECIVKENYLHFNKSIFWFPFFVYYLFIIYFFTFFSFNLLIVCIPLCTHRSFATPFFSSVTKRKEK